MFIPGISKRVAHEKAPLQRRKGGGGGRGGGGGGGSRGGSSSSGNSGSSSRPPAYSPGSPPPPYSVRGSSTASTSGRPFNIAAGQPFAGRTAGGGTRGQIYGGSYGRGGLVGLGLFPFVYWPLAFGGGYNHYYGSGIYGPPDNSSRPGGALQSFTLVQNGTTATGNTFALYGDHHSVEDLLPFLQQDCGVSDQYGANFTADPTTAVANYRGNTFALLLQGYNNSLPDIERESTDNSTLPDEVLNAQPAPLPSTVDTTYLNCLNSTIVNNLGLVQTSGSLALAPTQAPMLLLGLCAWLAFRR